VNSEFRLDASSVPAAAGGGVQEAVYHLMRRALQEHTAAWQEHMPRFTKSQYAILCAIADQPGIDQASAGAVAAIDKATLATVMLRLEQRGLVSRTVDQADRRRRLPELTEAGRDRLREAAHAANTVNQALLSRLEPQEGEQLRALLAKLTRHHGRLGAGSAGHEDPP
jgi:DNA-binding MarR family transcriptional regulator